MGVFSLLSVCGIAQPVSYVNKMYASDVHICNQEKMLLQIERLHKLMNAYKESFPFPFESLYAPGFVVDWLKLRQALRRNIAFKDYFRLVCIQCGLGGERADSILCCNKDFDILGKPGIFLFPHFVNLATGPDESENIAAQKEPVNNKTSMEKPLLKNLHSIAIFPRDGLVVEFVLMVFNLFRYKFPDAYSDLEMIEDKRNESINGGNNSSPLSLVDSFDFHPYRLTVTLEKLYDMNQSFNSCFPIDFSFPKPAYCSSDNAGWESTFKRSEQAVQVDRGFVIH